MSNYQATGNQGWKYLFNAPKQHYFKEGWSLCGRWMTIGWGECVEDNGKPQADECVSCRRKLTPAIAPKPKKRVKKVMPHESLDVAMAVVELLASK